MNQTEGSFISLFRWVGYGLLLFTVFDFVDTLIPPQLTNPVWELQTVGALVERVPVPLLGLALIFFAEATSKDRGGKPVLKALSWVALGMGVFYLVLIPLTLSNTWRINQQTNAQAAAQVGQQMAQIQQVRSQLNNATPQELNQLLSRFNQQSQANLQTTGQLKQQLAAQLAQAETNIKTQSAAAKAKARLTLLKDAVKRTLGALVSGVLFIRIWSLTHWARRKPSRTRRAQSAMSSS